MQKKTEDATSNKSKSRSKNKEINKNKERNKSEVRLVSLFWEFFKIGLFTIGGGAAMLPQLQQTVTDKGWMDSGETLDAIALSQSLPGLIAVNVGTYVGYRKRGVSGAFWATLGVVLPAFFAIIIALAFLNYIGDNHIVEGAFMGVKAAVCGLIIVTAVRLLKQMCRRGGENKAGESKADKKKTALIVFNIIMCLGSFIAVAIFGVTAILVILIGIVTGMVVYRIWIIRSREEDR